MHTYPKTKQVPIIEDHFGRPVADPYRWLEDVTDSDLEPWVDAQIACTQAYLATRPERQKIAQRLKTLYNYPKYATFKTVGEHLIYTYNTGLQPQSVYWIQKGIEGTPAVLINPNTLSEDGTVAVTLNSASKDDRYLTYLQSESGSDWSTLRLIDLQTLKPLEDVLTGIKFTHVAWFGQGFYYSRYALPEVGHELSALNENMAVYYHRLGNPQSEDTLIFEDKDHPLRYNTLFTTKDERYLVLAISEGTYGSEIRIKSLDDKQDPAAGAFRVLFKGFENEYDFLGAEGDDLFFITDKDAMNRKVIAYNPPQDTLTDVIPEGQENLENAWKFGPHMVLLYLKNVVSLVRIFDLKGALQGELENADKGSIYEMDTNDALADFYVSYGTFVSPLSLKRIDKKTLKAQTFKASELPYDASAYVTEQIFCTSKDGTQVPVFLTYHKALQRSGQNPTLLYAYGGFNVSLPPAFNPANILLIENGGIYAQANLRGGSEYGEAWHRDGMLHKKQNVFDDFIAVAETLIEKGYTSREHLAIQGGSNGGLLIGTVLNQRPDLFKVGFPQVGVMDMLRYHKFTVGWGWMVEYGNPEAPEHFENLYAYSPLHNIEAKDYPAVMVMTADHDDRVVPAHSYKYIAALQAKNTSANPVMIRIDKNAGHGAGKSVEKLISDQTDKYAFWGAFEHLL